MIPIGAIDRGFIYDFLKLGLLLLLASLFAPLCLFGVSTCNVVNESLFIRGNMYLNCCNEGVHINVATLGVCLKCIYHSPKSGRLKHIGRTVDDFHIVTNYSNKRDNPYALESIDASA